MIERLVESLRELFGCVPEAPDVEAASAPQVETVEVGPPSPFPGEIITVTVLATGGGALTGTLHSPNGTELPLSFEVIGENPDQRLWRARTRLNQETGEWRAEVRTGSERTNVGFPVTAAFASLPTMISGLSVSPEPARRGERLTVAGRLQASRDNEVWEGVVEVEVVIAYMPDEDLVWRDVTTVTTGRRGEFTAFKPAEGSGWFRAEFRPTDPPPSATARVGLPALRGVRSDWVHHTTAGRTKGETTLTHVLSPKKVNGGGSVTHSGRVTYWNGQKEDSVPQGTLVQLRRGSKKIMSKKVGGGGGFSITWKPKSSDDGDYHITFAKQGGGKYHAGSSGKRHLTVN